MPKVFGSSKRRSVLHAFDRYQWPVVRRMIHASGDLDLVQSVRFTPEAVTLGIQAVRDRTPIVTDVSMVAAGINKTWLDRLQAPIHCFIDDTAVRTQAVERDTTRSYCAIEKACAEIGDAIYVIGNAPTALLRSARWCMRGEFDRRLILAMPVGFVAVTESKDQAAGPGAADHQRLRSKGGVHWPWRR